MGAAVILAIAAVAYAAWRAHTGFVGFRRRLRAHLHSCPDIEWRRDTPAGMVCAVLGYPLEVDLVSTYVYSRRSRERESVLFDELASALRGRVPPVPVPPFPLVRDRILPLLKRSENLPPAAGYHPENRTLRRLFDPELSVVYVIEGQFVVTFVTEGMTAAWQYGIDGIHELAVGNLRTRTLHILAEIGGRHMEYVSVDGYDAARLLVADLIVPAGTDDPVVAIPHEHACLVAGGHQSAELARRARQEYEGARAPLTPRLYRITAGGPVPLPATDEYNLDVPEVERWTARGAASSASRT